MTQGKAHGPVVAKPRLVAPARSAPRARLEAEADTVSARARAGVVRPLALSPAPIARRLDAGPDTPLDGHVRERLERLFAADLAAVRVHSGVEARRALRDRRAAASGVHVYLGDHDAPERESSYAVLAHEVAHVLQQTGERRDDGRLVARERTGSAEPFGWTAPFAATRLKPGAKSPVFIWQGIADARGDTASYNRIQVLLDAIAAASSLPAFWADRAKHVIDKSADPVLAVGSGSAPKVADLEDPARSALYDGLKMAKEYTAAAQILIAFEKIESLVLVPKVYELYVDAVGIDHLLDRIVKIWGDEPLLGEARPNKALSYTALYLIGLFSSVLDLPIKEADHTYLRSDLEDVMVSAKTSLSEFPGELVSASLLTVEQLEEYRIAILNRKPKGGKSVLTHNAVLDDRVTLAHTLINEAKFAKDHELTIQGGTEPGYDGQREARYLIVRNYAPALGAIGAWALDFWQLGLLAVKPDAEALKRGLTDQTLYRIGSMSPEPFPGLATMLETHRKAFYSRTAKKALPSSAVYQANVNAAAQVIASKIFDIQTVVAGKLIPAWNANKGLLEFDASAIPADRTESLAQASWLIQVLSIYRDELKKYSQKEDDDLLKTWGGDVKKLKDPPVWLADDVRAMHRANAAKLLLKIGDLAGMVDLANKLRPIETAEEDLGGGERQDDDVLLITSGWKANPKGPIGKFSEDMHGEQIAGAEQFTAQQLVLFFSADRYRRISKRIDDLIAGPEGKTFSLDHDPLINQAIDTENASELQPVRHTIPAGKFLHLKRPPQQTAATGTRRTPLRLLIQYHPITQVTIKDWKTFVVPPDQAQTPDLVIWKLPLFDGLAGYLRKVPGVNDLLAKYIRVTANPNAPVVTAADLADPSKYDDAKWWALWEDLTDKGALALAHARIKPLKEIAALNKKLAEYALLDIQPPDSPPMADEIGDLPDLEWEDYFMRLAFDADESVHDARNLAFRKISEINAAIATYAKDNEGLSAPTQADIEKLSNDDWLMLWKQVIDVGAARRKEMRSTLFWGGFAKDLRAEQQSAWLTELEHERKALVHERIRIVKTLVEPMLAAYDPGAAAGDDVMVGKQQTWKREAAGRALDNLRLNFLNNIMDTHWITDPNVGPTERSAHGAAALLSVALQARGALVHGSSGNWAMTGWDRDVAWVWIPQLRDALAFLKKTPDITPWLWSDELPASSWVPDRQEALQNIYDGLWRALRDHQTEFGFVGVQGDGTFENPGGVHEVDNGARVFGPGHPFKIDGITWEILGVPTAFTFNPALVGVNPSDPVMPDILTIGGKEQPFDGSYPLVRVMKDGQYYDLHNDNDQETLTTLRELAYAVMMASTVEELNELAEGMEKGTMFVVGLALDIAELFPVAGQAAAAARVVLTVGGLVSDPNIQELFHALIDDPAGVIDKVKAHVTDLLSVEGLVDHLLLDPNLEFLEKIGSLIPPPRKTGSTTSGLGKVLRRLQALGHAIAGAIGRVVGFAHDVRDDIQGFIVEHPLLAQVLAFIADHLDLIIEAIEHVSQGNLDEYVLGMVSQQFMGIVNAIGRIRFPTHLITMDDIVDFFLNIVGNRLGGKYAIGYKVIKALLSAVGRWGEVEHLIGEGIVKVLHTDPSKYLDVLGDFANKWLVEHLQPVQQFTYNVLNTIFTQLPGAKGLPDFKPLSIEDSGDQFLDAAPLMRPGTVVAPMPETVELSSGRPLERGARKRFERELGSDLSHVRLHTGADAERATRAVGARALTTGSHVLVAPDVLLGTSGGDRVMRHELAHVLQQTGSRPPGSGDSPEVGQPGLGVRVDPAAEKIAEEIAVGATPSKVRAQEVGYQPDLIGLGVHFMNYVNHAERAKKEIKKIESTGAGTGRELIGQQVREDVANVGSALSNWIDGFSAASMSKEAALTFGSVADKIKAWLVERKSDITNAIDDLAIDSEHAVKLKDDSNETPEMALEEKTFQFKLVRFLLVATGCDIKIELNEHDGKLVADNPLKHATFELLYMPVIPATGAGADLWDTLMTNTFGAVGDPKKRAMTRIVLFALGTGENPYGSGFKLDDQRIKQINFDTPGLDTGKSGMTVERLPPASDFWYGLGTPPSDKTLPALWIGRHRDGTHHGKGGRQSHHTTQFLLVQYFEQAHASVAPFPVLRGEVANVFSKHMGFKIDSKQYVDKVADIEVGTLDADADHRGGGMPALLVAAVTHRRTPRMHIAPLTSEEKGEDDDVPSSQGGRLHRWFQEALDAVYSDAKNYWIALAALDKQKTPSLVGAVGADALSEPLDWFLENAPDLALKLPQAMRRVYARMRDQMIPAIRPGLETLEQTWYEQLALAKGENIDSGPYAVGPLVPAGVAKAAESNNTLIMETNSKWA